MANPLTFTGIVEFESEDCGDVAIAEIGNGDETPEPPGLKFVRIHSVDERDLPEQEKHGDARAIQGKTVRVTIEVID